METKLNCKTAHRWGGWLQAATLAAGVAVASTAHAQEAGTSGPQLGKVTVVAPTRNVALRTTTPNTKQHWISHQDCLDDVELTFRVAVSSPNTNASLEVFVGKSAPYSSTTSQEGCLYNASRLNKALCPSLDVKGNSKNTGAPIVVIKAQALVKLFGIESCGETAEANSRAPIPLQFYFLLNPQANNPETMTDYAIYIDTGIDLWGPEPPTDLVVTGGDEELQLSFAPAGSSSDVAGYRFFVDDGTSDAGAPMTSTSGGAGAATTGAGGSSAVTSGAGGGTSTSAGSTTSSASTSTGVGGAATSTGAGGAGGMSTASATSSASTGAVGSGAGGASTAATTGGPNLSTGVTGAGEIDACSATAVTPTCTAASFLLVAGGVPAVEQQRGDPLTSGTVGAISDLENGKAVVVGVAAFDDVGNLGKLSELQCGTPQPVLSVLRAYECAGGFTDSGCGFCSVGGDRGVSYTALVSAGLFVFGFAARRSRRARVVSAARGDR